MKEPMPQEIEVWDILPAIRREFAKVLINEHKLNQREAARLLRLTEPAVSQYVKSKRAKEIVFGKSVIQEIRKSASRVVADKKKLVEEMQRICNLLAVKKVVCDIHRSKSRAIPKECCICLK
jgi:predicted transcriptional regulator